ncbi:MAG: amidase [Proteobacteria bacterium]|nr:amidase [Pseudomonadota bacterium]
MIATAEFWKRGAAELSRLIAAKTVSPVELARVAIERARTLHPILNAVVTLDEPGAMAAARAAEARAARGARLGALDGIPLTVKDNLWVKGLRATWGSRLYETFVPEADDLAVARVRAEGAVILGKTNTPEFALQSITDNLLFGPTRNPWNVELTPGGSSGGAVAQVSSGIAPLAIGTDAGGSIRRPAAHAGVVGLKPSLGRVARAFGFPPTASDFQAIGPIARTVADAALLFAAIGRPDGRDRASLAHATEPAVGPEGLTPPPRLRLLYVPRVGDSPVEPAIAASVEKAARALAGLGHKVEEGAPPWDTAGLEAIFATLTTVAVARIVAPFADWRARVGPAFVPMAEAGAKVSGAEYLSALDRVAALRRRFMEAMAPWDAIISPASAAQPWPIGSPYPKEIGGREAPPRAQAVFSTIANAAGHPAISVPGEPAPDGMPVGVQLMGRFGEDNLLIRLAAEFEAACPWTDRWPGVS